MNFEQLSVSRKLTPTLGYAPHVGLLVASLEYTRLKTLSRVKDLSVYQLDYHQDANANSIGTLLLHMGAVEVAVQQLTFHGCGGADDQDCLGEWQLAMEMGERARQEIRGYSFHDYAEKLAAVRTESLKMLQSVDDDWLWREVEWVQGIMTNNYWLWYHVFEDEMGHRGEINWLMSRIPPATST